MLALRTALLTVALTLLGASACSRQPKIDATAAAGGARPVVPGDSLGFPAPQRPISRIVAPRWTGEPERDRYREAARVIALSGVRSGMTVADIGAGDGYYVARLSPAVGATGRVLGEDIVPQYLEILRTRVADEKLSNVEVVAGTADDPSLRPASVDVALLIHMYHEIERPFELLWHLSVALKPGATVTILDQDGPTDAHGTPPALLSCEMEALGYERMRRTVLDDGAYVALFRAPAAPVAPALVRERLTRRPCAS
jgi:SAM-dependent methyltransferase